MNGRKEGKGEREEDIELFQDTIISIVKKEAEIQNDRGGPSLGRIIKASFSERGQLNDEI